VSVVFVIALAGCGGSKSGAESTTTAAESAKPSESAQTSPGGQSAQATESATAGYGATEREWDAAHSAASDFPAGSAYDSDSSLPQVEGHAGARYTEVHGEGGRIVSYVYHFPSAPIAAAQRAVLSSELPADAHQLGFAIKPTCTVMLVESATLRRTLSGKVAHAGRVAVQFTSGPDENSYSAGAVSAAALTPSASKRSVEVEC
jgi:hypothetical protein